MRGMNGFETSLFRLLHDAGDAASYPRRNDSSATPLRKSQNSQPTCNLHMEYAQGKIFLTRKISSKGSIPISYLFAKIETLSTKRTLQSFLSPRLKVEMKVSFTPRPLLGQWPAPLWRAFTTVIRLTWYTWQHDKLHTQKGDFKPT
jgi:hypothetical protein